MAVSRAGQEDGAAPPYRGEDGPAPVPNQRSTDILAKLAPAPGEARLRRRGCGRTGERGAEPGSHEPPVRPPVPRSHRGGLGSEPIVCPNVGGTNPNWIFAEVLGIKDFKVPLALADENAHAPNENFPVECMLKG